MLSSSLKVAKDVFDWFEKFCKPLYALNFYQGMKYEAVGIELNWYAGDLKFAKLIYLMGGTIGILVLWLSCCIS